MTKITGVDQHKKRLRAMRGRKLVRPVTRAIFSAAQDLVQDAQLSITEGAVSGKNHEPSIAPNPPNNDTGVLANNIEAVSTGELKAEASSSAEYALAQEFGFEEGNLPERPYMRPAAKRTRPKAQQKVVDAVNKVIRRAGA